MPLSRRAIVTDIADRRGGHGGVAAAGAERQPRRCADHARGGAPVGFAVAGPTVEALGRGHRARVGAAGLPQAVSADGVRGAAGRRARHPAVRDGRHVPGHRLRRLLGGGVQPLPQRGDAQHAAGGRAGGLRLLDRGTGGRLFNDPHFSAIAGEPAAVAAAPAAPAAPGVAAGIRRGDSGIHGPGSRALAAHRAGGRGRAGPDRGDRATRSRPGTGCAGCGPSTRPPPGGHSSRSAPTSPASCTTW